MKPILCLLALASGIAAYAADTPRHSEFPANPDSVARSYAIDDVIIKGKSRTKHLGRRIGSNFFSTGPISQTGQEAGVPCNAGQDTWKLGTLRIYCYTQQADSLVFRLRLYRMEEKTVGEALPIPEIRLPLLDTTQFITADLSPYDIRVTGRFLLAVECTDIRTCDPEGGIFFNGRLGARTYWRDKPDSTWTMDKIGIGLSVEAMPVPPVDSNHLF